MEKQSKEVSIPCICLNDRGRPNEIPISKWIIKDRQYTIKEFVIHNLQGRIIGVKLWEIDLVDCVPYSTFVVTRFGIIIPEIALEAQIAIDKLIEESLKKEEIAI